MLEFIHNLLRRGAYRSIRFKREDLKTPILSSESNIFGAIASAAKGPTGPELMGDQLVCYLL